MNLLSHYGPPQQRVRRPCALEEAIRVLREAPATTLLTVYLITRFDRRNGHHRLVYPKVWVRHGCNGLGLPRSASGELGVIKVEDPGVGVKRYVSS